MVFQYPAMMVSPMQGELLDVVIDSRGGGQPTTYDAFLGSGTSMIEAMRRGLPFVGADINPLAVLLGKVESAEASHMDCRSAVGRVLTRGRRARGRARVPAEHWCEKWFRPDVATDLAALACAIRGEREVEVRRLCWASLAEVVRVSGNMRISAPKLQTRPARELERPIDVFGNFAAVVNRTIATLNDRAAELAARGWMEDGRYLPGLSLSVADVRYGSRGAQAEIVLTSPPYGDNDTTIPYGQVSYLPLRWIDVEDIADGIDTAPLQASKSLDTKSLGGFRGSIAGTEELVERSPALSEVVSALAGEPTGRRRVENFAFDLDLALARILTDCAPGAHLVITIGDRTVRGVPIRNSDILVELLSTHDVLLVERLTRQIPRGKRLARRNSYSATIGEEAVLILRAP